MDAPPTPDDEPLAATEPDAIEASAQVMSGAEADTETGRTHDGPPSPLVRNLVIGALITMVIANYAGGIFLAPLLDSHPAVLISLNVTNRSLALASHDLNALAFYGIGFLRLMLPDPFFFLLGRWYGDAAVRWMERKAPSYGQLLRTLEQWFHKARLPIVAFAPNNPICLFAGAAGMTWGAFLVADVIGTVIRLILIRAFSSAFEDLLGPVRHFLAAYKWQMFVLSFILVAFTIWSDRRGGRSSIGDLAGMDDDIAAAEAHRTASSADVEPE